MTYPVSGPFNKLEYLNGATSLGYHPRIYERSATWYRQAKPYNLPLNYSMYSKRVLSYSKTVDGNYDGTYSETTDGIPTTMGAKSSLYNRTYAAFKDKLGAHVEAGIALAEGKQAMDMLTKRVFQMYHFTNEVRHGKFGAAAETLGMALSPRQLRRLQFGTKKGSKDFADNYLEFHFGWSPLLKDIYDAAEVLSSPILPSSIVVRRRGVWGSPVISTTVFGADKTRTVDSQFTWQWITLKANVEVVNPNLALAQQCGLINPLTIAWEVTPFSFVADWFVNVGDFLQSFTDFAGLAITKPQRTIFSRWTRSFSESIQFNYATPATSYYSNRNYTMEAVYHDRIIGPFPGPTLEVRPPWTLSARRGLAAMSLLLQAMPKTAKLRNGVITHFS